ncbi:MAG: hypothetical protein AB8E15_01550 [Bdellovibrionales bacterium]
MSKTDFIPDWFYSDDIRPYIFLRRENRSVLPGSTHPLEWFSDKSILEIDPLRVENLNFAEAIYQLEGGAFEASDMAMPRWVFYDCAIIPGLCCGFAMRRSAIPESLLKVIKPSEDLEWVPISLFIAIPTAMEGQWVAHNLSSGNSFLAKEDRMKGLGFLTKAFGLWYSNIKKLCGVTQWGSPSIKLHSFYGNIEILTAYTPVHTHAGTLTYKSWVDCRMWSRFFTREKSPAFDFYYKNAGFQIDPKSDDSMKGFQIRIESGQGPFFLYNDEIRHKGLDESLDVFKLK